MKRKATGITFIFVSGILAYLALAIMFWQSAMAAPLGAKQELDADTLGFWHEFYNEEEYNGVAIVAISQMLRAAILTRAYEECRDRAGVVDYDCFDARQKHTFSAINKHVKERGFETTNEGFVQSFWQFAINMEVDEAAGIGFAASMYIAKMMDYLEPRS